MRTKTIIYILIALIFINCSKDNETKSVDETIIKTYEDPYFEIEASKNQIIQLYGDEYNRESNGFSLGYKMKYNVNYNGIVNYYFSLDNEELLYETEVLFYSGKNNVDFLKDYLISNYIFDFATTKIGLYSGYYYNDNISIELNYLEEEYSGITITYKQKSI